MNNQAATERYYANLACDRTWANYTNHAEVLGHSHPRTKEALAAYEAARRAEGTWPEKQGVFTK